MITMSSLQIDSIYEFTLEYNKDHFLGWVISISVGTNSVLFDLYSCQRVLNAPQKGMRYVYDIPEDNQGRFRISRLTFIKQVAPKDLPLYVGWLWHSPRFMAQISGGL